MMNVALTRYLANAISAAPLRLLVLVIQLPHQPYAFAVRLTQTGSADWLTQKQAQQQLRTVPGSAGGGWAEALSPRTLTRWSARSRTAPPCR